MKLFFSLFLIVPFWKNNNALRCVNHTIAVGFDASNLAEVKEIIDNLDTDEGYQVCYIQYTAHYPEKDSAVVFGFDISTLLGNVNMDVIYQITLILASNENITDPASVHKSVSFKCDDQDACERKFWRDHIDWLIREEFTALEKAFRSILYIENREKVPCATQVGQSEGVCEGDACRSIYDNRQNTIIWRNCASKDQRETSVLLMMKVSFSANGNTKDSLNMADSIMYLEYFCQFNDCTNQLIQNNLTEAIKYHINLSPMYEVFKANLHQKQTTEPGSESTGYSTTSETPDISTSNSPQTTTTTTRVPSTSTSTSSQSTSETPDISTSNSSQTTTTTTRVPSIFTSTSSQSTSTTSNPSPSISEQNTRQPPNTSILHFISMNILILHIVFLIFF